MILLDTNAVIWLLGGHRRARLLLDGGLRLYLSPVSLLELKLLIEVGRLEEAPGHTLEEITRDPRWSLDNLPSQDLFSASLEVDWTRDPFDRLVVAHARHRRWRLATGDHSLKARLAENELVPL